MPSAPEETNVWDREWDLLIVLDGCRADMMETIADDLEFVDSMDSIWSVGGHSIEWLQKTINERYRKQLSDTAYVSANYFADCIDSELFNEFEDVTELDYKPDTASVPAHVVTDRTVTIARNSNVKRIVAHYMQPHKPFVKRDGGRRSVSEIEGTAGWELHRRCLKGELSKEDVWQGHMDNLRYVLEEVEILLENVDADKAIITSDHGNAFGEGFLWDHSTGVRHPTIRRVPWAETTATDTDDLSPPDYNPVEQSDEEVEEQLEALGYR